MLKSLEKKKTGEKGERKIGVLYTLPNMMGASFTTKTLEVGYLRKNTKKVSTKTSLFCKLFEMKLKQKILHENKHKTSPMKIIPSNPEKTQRVVFLLEKQEFLATLLLYDNYYSLPISFPHQSPDHRQLLAPYICYEPSKNISCNAHRKI